MASELALVQPGQLAPIEFDDSKIALLKSQIAPDCSNDELQLFMAVCERTGLDPFARQIYAISRNVYDSKAGGYVSKMSIQTSIDGFRLIAERTGKWEGATAPLWCGQDGQWVDVWLSDEPPAAAKVGVHKQGFREPVVRVALWKEYAQTYRDKKTKGQKLSPMWQSMPSHMLAKVAESLALRAAFPNDLSGLYTREEMDVIEVQSTTVIQQPNPGQLVKDLVIRCDQEEIPVRDLASNAGMPPPSAGYSLQQYKDLVRIVDGYEASTQTLQPQLVRAS
ncbi:MAG: phage recombination protein Bet [Cyanobacteria bacterium P01_F01_bin.150]